MAFKDDHVEYSYLMPKWHFWALSLLMLPIGLGGLLIDIKDPFGQKIVPYLSIMILVAWLVYLPVKARNYFKRDQKIILEKDAVKIPTDIRGILAVQYSDVKQISLTYRNTQPWGAKIAFGFRKSVRIRIDYFENETCFTQFLEVINRRI